MRHMLRLLFVLILCFIALAEIRTSSALAEERWVGFSIVPTLPPNPDSMDYVNDCKSSLTRSFVIDANDPDSKPKELALRLPSSLGVVASRSLSGWTLSGQPILSIGIFQGDRKNCEGTTDPYPFNYESCICSVDNQTACVCPTMKINWADEPNAKPTNVKLDLRQVQSDPDHYYFQGQNPESRLFRINHDGSGLTLMAGAGGHGVLISPTLPDVYVIENHVVGPTSPAPMGDACITVRAGTAAENTLQNFRGYCSNEKSVYAKWSPDGLNLAFATKDHDTPKTGPLRIIVLPMDPDTKSVIREKTHTLTRDIYCSGIAHNSSLIAWASKPDRIYFATCPSPTEASDIIEVSNRENGYGEVRKITEGKISDKPFKLYPDVSPDSLDIVYVAISKDLSFAEIYVQDIALKSEPRKLLGNWLPEDWGNASVRFARYPFWQTLAK